MTKYFIPTVSAAVCTTNENLSKKSESRVVVGCREWSIQFWQNGRVFSRRETRPHAGNPHLSTGTGNAGIHVGWCEKAVRWDEGHVGKVRCFGVVGDTVFFECSKVLKELLTERFGQGIPRQKSRKRWETNCAVYGKKIRRIFFGEGDFWWGTYVGCQS